MPDIEVHLGRGRGRRGVSGLGLLLVVIGAVALAVSWSILPSKVYQLWPLILVAVGIVGLVRRPGWIDELDFAVPEYVVQQVPGLGQAQQRGVHLDADVAPHCRPRPSSRL